MLRFSLTILLVVILAMVMINFCYSRGIDLKEVRGGEKIDKEVKKLKSWWSRYLSFSLSIKNSIKKIQEKVGKMISVEFKDLWEDLKDFYSDRKKKFKTEFQKEKEEMRKDILRLIKEVI